MSEIINGLKEMFFGKKTPQQQATEEPKPEPSKVEAPSEPTTPEAPTLKIFPTGTPISKTRGIEKIKERY